MTVIFSTWGDLPKTKSLDDSESHQELVYPGYSEAVPKENLNYALKIEMKSGWYCKWYTDIYKHIPYIHINIYMYIYRCDIYIIYMHINPFVDIKYYIYNLYTYIYIYTYTLYIYIKCVWNVSYDHEVSL